MSKSRVALDSNCLSYLIDGIYTVAGPTGELAAEQIALARTMFYDEWPFYVTARVLIECGRIRNQARAEIHEGWRTLLGEPQPIDPQRIQARAKEFSHWHGDEDDCQILAECEDAELRALLTYDGRFIARLSPHTAVKLLRPTEYWGTLAIQRGSRPQSVPASSNALESHTWWRW